MAPSKNKNVMINDEGDSSAAATKRRMIEIMNGTTGVPFTNPITQFPSIHHNPPRNTTSIRTDLQLSPPAEIPIEETDSNYDDDDIFSSLIRQQNFISSYHMNQMQQNVEEFWRRNLSEEVKKRKEMEARVKEKEEEVCRFKDLYHFYEDKAFLLEEKMKQRMADEGCSAGAGATAVEEEVESCFVEANSVVRSMDLACKNCRSRAATMVWVPCRHLCVCLVCERRVKSCPICSAPKTGSFMIDTLP